jgi:hypothetical protein
VWTSIDAASCCRELTGQRGLTSADGVQPPVWMSQRNREVRPWQGQLLASDSVTVSV